MKINIYNFKFAAACFCFALIAGLFSTNAFACRCAPTSFNYRWTQSEEVFVGAVTEIKHLYKYTRTQYEDKPVKVTIKIKETLKTEDDEFYNQTIDPETKKLKEDTEENIFEIHTSIQNLTCMGYPFKEDTEYLIYAYKRTVDDPEHWSFYNYPAGTYGVGGLCGGTKKSEHAEEEMKLVRSEMEKQANDAAKKPKKEDE